MDDEEDMRIFMKTLFGDRGYETIEAPDAEQAFATLATARPDLVCLDVMLPGLSGIELYRKMKLDERTRSIPAVFVTSFCKAADFSGDRFRKIIPDLEVPEPEGYVEKPARTKTLLKTVEKALNGAGKNG